jgi:hypothetical protein
MPINPKRKNFKCINHPEKDAQSRDLCYACYRKWLLNNNPAYRESVKNYENKWRFTPEGKAYTTGYSKEWYRKNKDTERYQRNQRNSMYLREYGISLEQYEQMYNDLEGKCEICDGFRKRLSVDHCHKSGKVRGLLCNACNFAIGQLKELEGIPRAIKYLGKEV